MNIANTPKSIAMDFDANEIRIVEGKASKKGITITKHFSIKIPSEIYQDGIIKDMEQLSYLIKNGLNSNKIAKGNVHAVVNSSIILIREVAFPKVDKEDIDNLIQYQLGDFVPINPEDYVVKYINLGTFIEEGIVKFNMLIIGLPKNIVESHFNLIKDLDLKPVVLDYKGNAISKLLSYGESINGHLTKGRTLAFVDLSYAGTGFSIIKDELIELSRLVDGGLNTILDNFKMTFDLSEDAALDKLLKLDDISEEINESNNDYEIVQELRKNIRDLLDRIEMVIRYHRTREADNNIDLLILHGTLSKVKGMDKYFSNAFNIPCISLQTIDKLKFDGELSKYGNAIGGLIRVNGVR